MSGLTHLVVGGLAGLIGVLGLVLAANALDAGASVVGYGLMAFGAIVNFQLIALRESGR